MINGRRWHSTRNIQKWQWTGLFVFELLLLAGLNRQPFMQTPTDPPPVPSPTQPSASPHGAAALPSVIRRLAQAGQNLALDTPAAAASAAATSPAIIKPKPASSSPVKHIMIDNKLYPLRTYEPLLTPNDPSANQWWVSNTRLSQAWDTPPGGRQTLLAIIDTGFGLQHEEFANRWYVNPGESGPATTEGPSLLNCTDRGLPVSASCNLLDDDGDGIVDNETGPASYQNPSRLNCTAQGKPLNKSCNRIDDDGNGYIDDVSGWDFANSDNLPQAGEVNPSGSGTHHGTETTGVAAATGNNSKGIAGVDWQTKILPLQALDDDSYGTTLTVGKAIIYAASRGADVISISLGSSLPDDYVRQAVQIATAAGSIVVASSGNDGCDCIAYPANYPEVLAVGALGTNSLPASFSSYGDNLDMLAPGTQITTSNWTAANPTNAYVANVAGTSFAAPMVAGTLTRLLSRQPAITPLQLLASLTENTNRLTIPPATSRTGQLGYGTLDAYAATQRGLTARTSPLLYQFSPVSHGGYLRPGTPYDPLGSYTVHACDNGQPGTTPLYELTKASSQFFSVSPTETWAAEQAGYTSKLFAESCLTQPQDTPQTTRNLNLFKEFRNIFDSKL